MTRTLAALALLFIPCAALAADDAATASSAVGTAWSLFPAAVAIVLALTTRQVMLSLLGGIYVGIVLLKGVVASFPRTLDHMVSVTADRDHAKVILFTLLMGAMIAVVTASGGTKGVVAVVAQWARTRRSAALSAWGMGMVIFFDDYASTLLVGSTMRPITDKLRVSREKLSYIVDSTAAPIASLAIATTWVGYEVSTMGDAMKAAGIVGEGFDPYSDVFVAGIPSRFYQIFALLFVAIVAWMGRDFGPMLKAERRAFHEGKLQRDGARPLLDASVLEDQEILAKAIPRWWLAAAPIGALVVSVLLEIYVLDVADPYDSLLYASAIGTLTAVVLAVGSGSLSVEAAMSSCVQGVRAMVLAVVVLLLAWGIGQVMKDLGAGPYVAALLGDALPAWSLPTVTFLLAGVIAFATGTSYGTMGILFPIVVPVVALHRGDPEFMQLLIASTSAILGGAVFGDHCSPISDTTVLSSISSSADHVDHTRTQAPYALLCGGVALLVGYLPMGLGVPSWLLAIAGVGTLVLILRLVGTPVETVPGKDAGTV